MATEPSHGHSHNYAHGRDHDCVDGNAAPLELATDPVCGMKVNPAVAKHRLSYEGQDYFFCCARCRERFAAEPEKYLAPRTA